MTTFPTNRSAAVLSRSSPEARRLRKFATPFQCEGAAAEDSRAPTVQGLKARNIF